MVIAANQISGLNNISKRNIKNYETKVVLELEFSMHFISPIDFLERFLRIFGMDQVTEHNIQVKNFAHHMCMFTQCNDQFLNYKPSQIAAASLLLAINLSSSTIVAETFGFKKFPYPEVLPEQKLQPTTP